MYLMVDTIVYWLLDAKPLTKSTSHPSNISREYLLEVLIGPGTTTEMEMAKVLAMKPRFIVTKNDIWYLRDKPRARSLLEETLASQYDFVELINGTQIFRRR